jgi:Xaa-Pro aminopeptidase
VRSLGRPAWAQVGSPAGPVPVLRLEARRTALLDRLGDGVAIIFSSKLKSIEGDYPQDSNYRENNDFFYLSGLEAPGSILVLSGLKDEPDQTILYLPARDSIAEKWTGPRVGPGSEAKRLTGIADIRSADRAEREIRALVLATASPARTRSLYVSRDDKAAPDLVRDLTIDLSDRPRRIDVKNLEGEIARLRLVKGSDELSRLRRAIAITAEALNQSMRVARPGMWEYELEASVEYAFRPQRRHPAL